MPRPIVFVLIVALGVGLDIALHMLTEDFLPLPEGFVGSLLMQRLGFATVALAWAVLAFTGMALVFLRIERHMSGSGLSKGLRYGIVLGLVIQVAMIEGVALFGNRLTDELVVGLSDALPIVIMGALLGRFMARETPRLVETEARPSPALNVVLLFAVVFTLGRLGAQSLGLIDSAISVRPWVTLAWTVAMGATIGVFYLVLREALPSNSLVPRALAFGLGVFGVNWALFMVFVPLIFPDTMTDFVLRIGVDVLLVTLACLLAGGRWGRGAK